MGKHFCRLNSVVGKPLSFVAEYDMQRQASCEDGGLYGTHVHIHAHVEEKTQHKTPKEVCTVKMKMYRV